MKIIKKYERQLVLGLAVLAVFLGYIYKLMQMQIVSGEEYSKRASQGSVRIQKIKAARGEIVDRYGRPLAINRIGYDIELNRAFMTPGEENQTILRLIELMEDSLEGWIDTLPLTVNPPYEFAADKENDVAKLRRSLGLGVFATAEDCMHWLIKNYKLEEYPPEQQRKLAGVRWEMTQHGFSLTVPYTFARDIKMSTVTKISEHSFEIPGVFAVESPVREYVAGDIAPHLIGITGPIFAEEFEKYKEQDLGYALDDRVGKSGIEKAFEKELRGQDGRQKIAFDSYGKVVEITEEIPQVPGNTVVLTIDKELQEVAQNALAEQIKNLQDNAAPGKGKEADKGAVVAIDPKTGEILAAATYPGYSYEQYFNEYSELAKDPKQPLFDRSLLGVYAPGSTFKPVTAIAGMSSGVVDENSLVYCGQVYNYYKGTPFTCMYHHGDRNVKTALQVSCNIYFYDVGRRTGIEKMNETTREFGLGLATGIELPEALGQISSPETKQKLLGEQWYPGDVAQSAIGQLYNGFTPLQFANYAATIANKGKRMDVNILKSIKSYNFDKTVFENTPKVADTVTAKESDFNAVIEGMRLASIPGGTAYFYLGPTPYSIASKTGTPQTESLLNSAFICFAPIEDPQIAVAVIIEKGYHGYTGAPVARKIMDAYLLGKTDSQQPQESGELLP